MQTRPSLRRVEPFERAIGRVHGRRLLLRWLAKQAGKQQKYSHKNRFVNAQPQRGHVHARDVIQPLRRALSLFRCGRRGSTQRRQAQGRLGARHGLPPVLPFGPRVRRNARSAPGLSQG